MNSSGGHGPQLTRRVVLKLGGGAALTAVMPWIGGCGASRPMAAGAGQPTARPSFLTEPERATLRALVDRLIPPDTDPGAAAGACEDAIDALLGAFQTDPPFLYAGAPFSDRGGAATNNFLEFIALDSYEEFAWRLAIEGSQGIGAREFNGPVKGMQAIYRDGLARLDERAQDQGFGSFADAPAPVQDQIIGDTSDAAVQELVDIAFPDTLDAMYGAPEYGGNQGLVGWGFTDYDGDVQPRGYTDEQVVNADNPGPLDPLLPPSYGASSSATPGVPAKSLPPVDAAVLPLLLSTDSMAHMIMGAGGSLRALREQIAPLAEQPVRLAQRRPHDA